MAQDGYEADRQHVMIYEIESGKRWDATPTWDRSPAGIVWAPSGDRLYLLAEDLGHVKVFDLDLTKAGEEPKRLTSEHVVSHVEAVSDDKLLLTWNSLTTPNQLSVLERSGSGETGFATKPLATLTKGLGEAKMMSPGEEFWFAGDEGEQVHGWILFPPEAMKLRAQGKGTGGKKWPLAFLCHGGPQSAWNDGWSTRCESDFGAETRSRCLTRPFRQGTKMHGPVTATSSSRSTGAAVPASARPSVTKSRTTGAGRRSGCVPFGLAHPLWISDLTRILASAGPRCWSRIRQAHVPGDRCRPHGEWRCRFLAGDRC